MMIVLITALAISISVIPSSLKIVVLLSLAWASLFLKLLIQSTHVLTSLLTLELFMLTTLLLFTLSAATHLLSSALFLVFFTMAVCEACLGLGILIHFIRLHDEELLSYLS